MLFPSLRRTVLPTLLRWLGEAMSRPARGPVPPSGFRPAPADGAKAARPALEKRFRARILSNAALKGNLSDAQYGPIDHRALSALREAVEKVQRPGTPLGEQEMQQAYLAIADQLNAEVRHTVGAARAVARRFTEQLRENESLAGGLTDDEYKPILDAAVLHVKGAVEALADPGSPEAEAKMENTMRVITNEVRAKVAQLSGPS